MYGSTSLRPQDARKTKEYRRRNGRQNASPTIVPHFMTVGRGLLSRKKRNFCQIKRSIRELPLRIGGVFCYFAQRASTSNPHSSYFAIRTCKFALQTLPSRRSPRRFVCKTRRLLATLLPTGEGLGRERWNLLFRANDTQNYIFRFLIFQKVQTAALNVTASANNSCFNYSPHSANFNFR